MAWLVPFASSVRLLHPPPASGINQAQSQRNSHPRCCESTETTTPCWPTSWRSGQSSNCRFRSGSAYTCSRPLVGLDLSGERHNGFVSRRGKPVRKIRTMPMAYRRAGQEAAGSLWHRGVGGSRLGRAGRGCRSARSGTIDMQVLNQ